MEIQSFVFSPLYENTYVLWDDTKNALIVDPGCYEKYEFEELISFIDQSNLNIKAIVNTHCHIDHVLGNAFLKTRILRVKMIHKFSDYIGLSLHWRALS